MKSAKSAVLLFFSAAVIITYILFEIIPFAVGAVEQTASDPVSSQKNVAEPVAEEAELTTYTVRFISSKGEETVVQAEEGSLVSLPQETEYGFLYWKTSADSYADIANTPVYADAEYTAVLGPSLSVPEDGWFAAEEDGLFHPQTVATRTDLAISVYELFEEKPQSNIFLNDVLTNARCYESASSLATAGYMQLDNGAFNPDEPLTAEDISFTLKQIFDNYRLEELLSAHEGETFTRGELCSIIFSLLPNSERTSQAYFPDVAPSDTCYEAVCCAGINNVDWSSDNANLAEGFINVDGWLYYCDDSGYFVKDTAVGTLNFGSDCRYSCGNEELDGYVADVIAEYTSGITDREKMLYEVYKYTRDKNLYLTGEIYELYKTGWEIEEALKLFTKAKGNCYSYAAQFWALARGLGYEAVCISGTIGDPYGKNGQNPHGWVEIEFDGVPYIFDCETEGVSYRIAMNDFNTSFFKITYERGQGWSYVRDSSCKYAEEAEAANAERFPAEEG